VNYLAAPPLRRSFSDDEGRPAEWTEFFTELVRLFNDLQRTGTTAQRPVPAPFIGYMHFDTTLNIPVWAKTSTVWIDATGAVV
jgi:hypothetical protein